MTPADWPIQKLAMSNTILITGGAGFIGSCLVRQLIAETQTQVINLDKLTYAGNLDSLAEVIPHPRHTFVYGDIADRTLVADLLQRTQPSAVVHLAAESHVDRSIEGPAAFVQTNVVGTSNLLEVVRDYWSQLASESRAKFRFLHVSTDEVYGSLGPTGAFTETTPYSPNSPYSASKAAADHLVHAYHVTYGLPTLITNTCNNFGPCQFPEKLIPLIVLNAIEGKPLPVYGDGLHVRDWIFVEDHCRALRMILERARPGSTYNVGANCERTNLTLVRQICQLIDKLCPGLSHSPTASLICQVADRPGHDRRYAIDSSKLTRELGWRPQHDFDSSLASTIEWYLKNGEWVQRITSGMYQRERLGLIAA
jgi:dTDP-glucose 4,6-dehydratase